MATSTGSSAMYDVVILGGGSGGYACALRSAQLGRRVALIEKAELGGTCLHRGCIPTKAMLHSAEVADLARAATSFGVQAQLEGIDMPAVHRYKDGVVGRLHKGLQGLVASAGIEMVSGHGRLTSANTVHVQGRDIQGNVIVLATGSRARLLAEIPIGGPVVTSDEAMTVGKVPDRVVILGGGVIGVEFASIYRSFGAEVTVVEAAEHLIPNEDIALSQALRRAYRKRGIAVMTGVSASSTETTNDEVSLTLSDGSVLSADLLLVAIGRAPVTDDMGFEEVGVHLDRGFVRTDDRLRTTVEGVYAVGDIVPGLQLAHRGFAQGIFVAEHIAGGEPTPINESGIPRVTYSDPEVVSVGATEAEVRAEFGNAHVAELNLGGNGKSQILKTTGFVKVVSATAGGPVLGVHMIGARMSEQAGEAQLIVNWEALPAEVAALVHAHPTQNEAVGEAHMALAGAPLHSHS
ncbi:MAG: dihydrolipoyl dehydrogenase [Ornithinimicrobium sp.]